MHLLGFLFAISDFLMGISVPPSPLRQIDAAPNRNDLGHYNEVFHELHTIKINAIIVLMPEIIFVSN